MARKQKRCRFKLPTGARCKGFAGKDCDGLCGSHWYMKQPGHHAHMKKKTIAGKRVESATAEILDRRTPHTTVTIAMSKMEWLVDGISRGNLTEAEAFRMIRKDAGL